MYNLQENYVQFTRDGNWYLSCLQQQMDMMSQARSQQAWGFTAQHEWSEVYS